jgi:hypothetical protein
MHVGEKECICDIGGNTRKKEATKKAADGWIIFKWILENYDEMLRTGLFWLRIGSNGGLL